MSKKNKKEKSIFKTFLKIVFSFIGVGLAIFFIFGKADIIIKTTSNNYNVNCNFMIVNKGNSDIIDDKVKNYLTSLEMAYSTISRVDSDINNLYSDNVYVIDDFIYYYKNNSNKLFRYNLKENKIEEFNQSKYINDDITDISLGVNTLASEALLNYYPEIIKHIDEIDGTYKHQMFYDKDRIFFVVDNDVYEYHILRDRTRLVMKDIDENIEYIFVK